MAISVRDDGALHLQGDLHISDVEELRTVLIGRLETASELVLDLSGVDRCDTASLQLLCSVKKSAERDRKQLCISSLSPVVREVCTMTGLPL